MIALLKLFRDLALLRRGPDSAPSTPVAMVITIAMLAALTAVLEWLLPRNDPNLIAKFVVSVVFTLGWYRILLTFSERGERFVQTIVAVFGYQIILLPLLAVLDASIPAQGGMTGRGVAISLAFVGLLAWSLTVNTRIVEAALERPAWIAALLVLAEFLTQLLLLDAMFGQRDAA